ncbi:hypothetical protein AAG570_006899 [Ranatra chinensis]|uniref:Uncharacterized protein n=1 Tax=Ranatra chinensis TaxID=642074 RepID=A0ABD0YVF2_9HEMI
MASKRRNMLHKIKKQETTENGIEQGPVPCGSPLLGIVATGGLNISVKRGRGVGALCSPPNDASSTGPVPGNGIGKKAGGNLFKGEGEAVRRSTRHRRVRGEKEVTVSSSQTLKDLKLQVHIGLHNQKDRETEPQHGRQLSVAHMSSPSGDM